MQQVKEVADATEDGIQLVRKLLFQSQDVG